jgi:2-iminobutanoate/2-iminopropanoate deaminase
MTPRDEESGEHGMSEARIVQTEKAPAAIGPYSQAMVSDGLVFCSGQIPMDPETMQLTEGDVAVQTDQVMRNLAAVLAAAGASLNTVVKTTVFLSDMGDFTAMNEVYARHFGDHKPARATVQAAALPKNVAVEIEAIARAV